MMTNAIFGMFAGLAGLSALGVVFSRNAVRSVISLVFCFFNLAGVSLFAGAELVAMSLIIVYIGAVAVLFLFVVMMLKGHIAMVSKNKLWSIATGLLVLGEMFAVYWHWDVVKKSDKALINPLQTGLSNTQSLGTLLYTDYFYIFQVAGVLLLVAMIGSIALAGEFAPKSPKASYDLGNRPKVKLVKPGLHKGIKVDK